MDLKSKNKMIDKLINKISNLMFGIIILMITSQKGGTGKTTTITALALYLSEIMKKRVLLIDTDSQGNLSSRFKARNLNEPSIYELISGKETFTRKIYKIQDGKKVIIGTEEVPVNFENVVYHYNDKIDIIRADIRLIELLFSSVVAKEFMIRRMLKKIDLSQYDIVLIDTSASFGEMHTASLAVASHVLLAVQTEPYSVEGAVQMKSIMKRIQSNLENDVDIDFVVATMYNSTRNIDQESLEKVQSDFPEEYMGYVSRAVGAIEADLADKSIFKYSPKSKIAIEYKKICEGIYKKLFKGVK